MSKNSNSCLGAEKVITTEHRKEISKTENEGKLKIYLTFRDAYRLNVQLVAFDRVYS